MKKILFGLMVVLVLLFAVGCKDTTDEAVTLKNRINNGKDGEEIDLGKETLGEVQLVKGRFT